MIDKSITISNWWSRKHNDVNADIKMINETKIMMIILPILIMGIMTLM